MEKAHTHIEKVISRKKPGTIIFPAEFRSIGSDASVRQALSRLARAGKIRRLGHGIYFTPKVDPLLGEIKPSVDEVLKVIADKERIRIKPAGAFALHRLGLTTQVPTRLVYFTDGSPRNIKVGKLQITFKAVTPKKMSTIGKYSSLVIQAIEELGVTAIPKEIEVDLVKLLRNEEPKILSHDLRLATAKTSDYILKILKLNVTV